MTSIPNPKTGNKPQSGNRVEVIDLRLVQHGSIRAYARVKLGPLTIAGVKVIQQPGQRAWVRLPDQQGKDGRWYPIVTCGSPTLEEAITAAVLEAYAAQRGGW